ncbi:PREDICTED: probable rhamnogalacturonate lyase C [Lupinus angustifolius]|uniref:probable rhamnogalacturonate lyase C n=1 Tax=Lupinus angustifolius TaxID=3871 RepID=UPI00092F9F1E|nr:PREDICTED: probable rhamnogalacturonate lyase C [Lupinus angustifolius]
MKKPVLLLWQFGMTMHLFLLVACCEKTLFSCYIFQLIVDNGIVKVTLSIPEGYVIGISYNGIDNILNTEDREQNRGYLDVNWNNVPSKDSKYQRIFGTQFSTIIANNDVVEVSFLRTWKSSMNGASVPFNIDTRYIFRRGDSGFYSYAIFDRPEGLSAVEVDQIRIVFKLQKNRFKYMAIADKRQRKMPTLKDRETGQTLAYPEAVLLTKPSDPKFIGEVDDKYQYSSENKDNYVHGWIDVDSNASIGFWMITPSNEFRNGGPIKQDLTSHVGPITLSMFVSTHYAGKEATMAFKEGETYKKVFGPVFVYLNSASTTKQSLSLWSDAVQQKSKEVEKWPYDFPHSKDFFPSNKRGTIMGRLRVQDSSIKVVRGANNAYVGLALPGDAGSWQKESKGYQFWTRADQVGNFAIKNIVPGVYNLYAWVPGFIGDYKYNATITIKPGGDIDFKDLLYNPPRNGPTLWEIGIPDRSAAEFYVPDSYPNLVNKLYQGESKEKFRQYGLWSRYTDLYPKHDLVYTIGVNNFTKDWFYAHVPRDTGKNTYLPTTWEIIFEHQHDIIGGNYTLQLALASAAEAELEVRFNNPSVNRPHFSTGLIGGDNAIARHGIHGLHRLFSIGVPSSNFVKGKNIIYLKQIKTKDPWQGVMYDYIRLEMPSTS